METEETRIQVPKANLEKVPEHFRLAYDGSLDFDKDKKIKCVDPLNDQTGTPFNRNKFTAPNREIMYWALSLGLSENSIFESKNGSSTVPHNVFENSIYTNLLSRVACILLNDSVISVFNPNNVKKAVEVYTNGGINTLFEYTLGTQSCKDIEEGLLKLIDESLPATIEVIERFNPLEILEE